MSKKRPGVGGKGGAPAPCVFQRLRLVGQELDGELAQLVPPGLTSAQTDAVIPAGTLLPSRSQCAESRIPPSHLPPLFSTPVPSSPTTVHLLKVIRLNNNDLTADGCTAWCTRAKP